MSTYPAGTVAVATVRGVEGVRVMRVATDEWSTGSLVKGFWWHDDARVTDVRPLVVLDLSNQPVKGDLTGRDEPTLLASMLRETADNFFTPDAAALADKVADQIEAQTKPSRIPEPGLWGVVEAHIEGDHRGRKGFKFVRAFDVSWMCTADSSTYRWDDLIDPTLIREGVES